MSMIQEEVFSQKLFKPELFIDREIKLRGFQKLLRPETPQAVMLIRAPLDMGKSWLAHKMLQHCTVPDVNLPVAYVDFRDTLDKAKLIDELSLLRLLRDRLNAPAYFNRFNQFVNSITGTAALTGGSTVQARFAQEIEKHFSLGELERFSRPLGVVWENLPGTLLNEKSFQLVSLFFRSARMEDLLTRLEQTEEVNRIQWREIWASLNSESTQAADRLLQDLPQNGAPVADQGLLLPPQTIEERRYVEGQLSVVFFACLSALIADRGAVVFLVDSFDDAPDEARGWLRRELLRRLREEHLREIVVVVTTRDEVPHISDLRINDLLVSSEPVPLEAFEEEDVRAFMASRNMVEEPPDFTLKGIMRLSGGVPGELARMANRVRAKATTTDDFFKDL